MSPNNKTPNKLQSILTRLSQPFSNPGTRSILWWGLLLGLVVGCSLVPISGYDWYTYFLPQALEMSWEEVFNPLWTYLVLTPLAWLPGRWTVLSCWGRHFACQPAIEQGRFCPAGGGPARRTAPC